MAAVPSIGRASRVERDAAPGALATSELYERYSGQVFGFCLNQLGSREDAEDAVQTTFMNAFRGLARGIVPEAEQAWLFKIAHNVCLSRRRSSWRRGRVEAPNNMEVLQEVIPAKEPVADELIRLQEVLEQMPEPQRRAILLREWQGLSYREVAEELGVSQAAVETLIFRARRSLAAGLEEAPDTRRWRKRLRRGADVGGVLAFVKAMVGGGGAAAVKIATVVALTGAAVVTTAADHMLPRHPAPTTPKLAATVARANPTRRPTSGRPTSAPSVPFVVPRHDAVLRPVAPRARITPPWSLPPSAPISQSPSPAEATAPPAVAEQPRVVVAPPTPAAPPPAPSAPPAPSSTPTASQPAPPPPDSTLRPGHRGGQETEPPPPAAPTEDDHWGGWGVEPPPPSTDGTSPGEQSAGEAASGEGSR